MTTYKLLIGGRLVAQFEVVEYRDPGGLVAMKIPGGNKVPDVTLKRGVIVDPNFANWIKGAKTKHDVVLQTVNGAGVQTANYWLTRSWVTKYKGPTLGSKGGNDVAIEELEIEHEGSVIGLPKK